MNEIRDYLTPDGRIPFKDWLSSLADRMAKAWIVGARLKETTRAR
jgi:putative component of toxin-antitoxin plasmid stabilization module